MKESYIYYVPGRHKILADEIGQVIASLGFSVQGQELMGDFERLSFSEQIVLIRTDLRPKFWHPKSILIGHSFGAYLLLHALAEMKSFAGKVLLFSPVIGAGISKNRLFGSIPPRSKNLLKLAESGKFPAPRYLEIHTGADDIGCDPKLAERFSSLFENTKLHLVGGAGHQLGEKYLRNVIEKFLSETR